MYVRLFLGNKEPETFIVILIWAAIAWRINIPTPQNNAFLIFPKAKMTWNKNVHNCWQQFQEYFAMPFNRVHFVWSISIKSHKEICFWLAVRETPPVSLPQLVLRASSSRFGKILICLSMPCQVQLTNLQVELVWNLIFKIPLYVTLTI